MQVADYSAGRPTGAALRALGFSGVLRYVGIGGAAKRITAAEYRDLVSAGLWVGLVAEQSTTDAWGGYDAGVANADAARADARALGIPDDVLIFAAADSHAANQAQIDAAVQYARGFRDVLSLARTGFYGFQETLTAVRNSGFASAFWRCGSEPTAAEKTWTNFWQRNTAPTIRSAAVPGGGTIPVDINEVYNLPSGGDNDMTPEQDNRLRWLEQSLRTITNQLTGDTAGDPFFDGNMNYVEGHLPGWASMVDGAMHSPVDFLRLIDRTAAENNAKLLALTDLVGKQNGVTADDIATALQASLSASLLPVLEQVVTQALGADNAAQAEQIAADVVTELGQRLNPGS